MRINHNVAAAAASRGLNQNSLKATNSMERLSSGRRINKAGDDAAGLAISEKMNGQIRGLKQASRNAQDGVSLIQTAEGALSETHSILQRMRELAVQSANDTNTAVDRGEIQKEVDQLVEEIDRIATTTQFNTQNLLDVTGGTAGTFTLQIGANDSQTLAVAIGDMQSAALGVDAISLDTDSATSSAAITTINDAIETVSAERSQLGAFQNRLESTISNLGATTENLATAKSRITDVDMAQEMIEFTKNNILTQAATAMITQAKQQPESVLQILR